MEKVLDTAINYFSASEDYFWSWADHGRVIEFANKKTICYREELTFLLRSMPPGTRFPLGSILLIICACKENWESLYEVEQQLMRHSLVEGFTSNQYLNAQQTKQTALGFLKVVNSLPLGMRMGIQRTALISSVFSSVKIDEALPDVHDMEKDIISGELDYTILRHRKKLTFKSIDQDLTPLVQAFAYFPDKESLELKLKTGLTTLPKEAPLALPEESGADLLGLLQEDVKTRVLCGLTRQIMAAISIPIHLAGSSEQLLGGVADISNRGPYDKLLLSELAQDDDLLTARLANNEALFLKRETTPDNSMQELGVFMDVTLKMWGMPRIMALATGLAFRESKQRNQKLQVWSIGGHESKLIDIDSKSGIIKALEDLDLALNCGAQLLKTVKEQVKKGGKYILISNEHFLQDATMSAAFHQIREQLSFLVTVGHHGHIRLFKIGKGQQRLINEAIIDPFGGNAVSFRKKAMQNYPGMPAIMLEPVFPLYYPASKIKMNQRTTYVLADKTVIVVTQDRRVLCWTSNRFGAVEIVDYMPTGDYCFGETNEGVFILLYCSKSENLHVYHLNISELRHELYEIVAKQQTSYMIKFINQYFYMVAAGGLDIFDPKTMKYLNTNETHINIFNEHQTVTPHFRNFNPLKKLINTGFSVINSANSVYLHTAGKLFVDKRVLELKDNTLYWKENTLAAVEWFKPVKVEQLNLEFLPNIKFTRYMWQNGSEALLDSRGMLHLKAADENIPEISVLMIVNQPTACWCSNGVVSGPVYFTRKTNAAQIESNVFYENYIQPFLNALQ